MGLLIFRLFAVRVLPKEGFSIIFAAILVDLRDIYGLGDKKTKELNAFNKKQLKKKIIKILFNKNYESSYLRLQEEYINKSILLVK